MIHNRGATDKAAHMHSLHFHALHVCSALHVSYLDLSDCELSSSHMAGLVRWLERRSTPSQLLGFKPEPGADNSTLILHGNAPAGRIGKDLPIPGQSGKVSAAIC